LLSALYDKALTGSEICEGIQAALDAVDDFTLDIRDGVDMLAKFIARGTVWLKHFLFVRSAKIDRSFFF